MEKKVINRFHHQHPLILTENVSEKEIPNCYGCGNPVTNLELAYVCSVQNCSNRIILHKKCGELPSEILHPKHPQHPIPLFDYHHELLTCWCDICLRDIGKALGYQCSSCNFDVDITCPIIGIDDSIVEGKIELHHPKHPLTLMRKPLFSFYCDGCGVQDMDMACICSTCEFMIHKRCALLPLILPTDRHHHHLSLAFSFPEEYKKYVFDCDVRHKRLGDTCWVYFCDDCRFFAHLWCVSSTTTETTEQDSNLEEDDTNLIVLPLYAHDISKKLITPFVMREKGLTEIPDVKDMPTTVNMHMPKTTASFSFLFNYCHNHLLSLVAERHDDNKIMDEEDEDEPTNHGLKICNVCVTPISSPPYYECARCKYFIHTICYLLPKTLSSSSSSTDIYGECLNKHDKNHRFTLYTSSELLDMDSDLGKCELCGFITNGMVYSCEGCEMKIDVKCASLPTTIRHASHRHHKRRLVLKRIASGGKWKKCHGCRLYLKNDYVGYCCSSDDDCGFALDLKCVMLPASITRHEWDKYHPLMLSFDASHNHPSDSFCDFCEVELHPKSWMYHCRQCGLSFHLFCLETASGWYRNIKFGRRFVLDRLHPNHPLTFSYVTIKRRCDHCDRKVHNYCGFECASCNYLVCLLCAGKVLANMM